jgi:hypothetical protein
VGGGGGRGLRPERTWADEAKSVSVPPLLTLVAPFLSSPLRYDDELHSRRLQNVPARYLPHQPIALPWVPLL